MFLISVLNGEALMAIILSDANLFNYATSELSQDAFLCWLIAHGKSKYKSLKPLLYECAREFIRLFCDNQTFNDLEIRRQYQKIDILVIIDGHYYIIEDKIFSSEHGGQINVYKNTLVEKDKIPIDRIHCIYYKPIEECRQLIIGADYNINRERMLSVLTKYSNSIKSDIFNDYVAYLNYIEERTLAYRGDKDMQDWDSYAYRGLLNHKMTDEREQQTVLLYDKNDINNKDKIGWGYVPNRDGGFWGLWWNQLLWDAISGTELFQGIKVGKDTIEYVYLQFEGVQGKERIAIKAKLNKAKEERNKYKDEIREIRIKLEEYFQNKLKEKEEIVHHNDTTNNKIEFHVSTRKPGESITVGYISVNKNNFEYRCRLMATILKDLVPNSKSLEMNKTN